MGGTERKEIPPKRRQTQKEETTAQKGRKEGLPKVVLRRHLFVAAAVPIICIGRQTHMCRIVSAMAAASQTTSTVWSTFELVFELCALTRIRGSLPSGAGVLRP